METVAKKVNTFKMMNKASQKGSVVCFGSTYFASIDMGELAVDSNLGVPVYNRSIEGLDIAHTAEVLDAAVYDLQPAKVFVNIGEEDAAAIREDIDAFINKYEWMLLNIHRNCHNCRIFIVSVVGESDFVTKLNERLHKLASSTGCLFIDINYSAENESPMQVFNILKPYIRTFPLTFVDAMRAC